jgi:uncharacterized protein YjbI with pentapeptide repeats
MKKKIKEIDLSVLLPSGASSRNLELDLKNLVSPSALRDVLADSMFMGRCVIHQIEFVNCQFRNSTLDDSEFTDCRFINCLFDNCKMVEVSFSDCTFDETRFNGCDLFQTYFFKSALNSILFSQGKSEMTMFVRCAVDSITATNVACVASRGKSIERWVLDFPDTTFLENYVVEAGHRGVKTDG